MHMWSRILDLSISDGVTKMKTPSYVALSQQMVMRKQIGVIANNVANSGTPGYKADRLIFAEHLTKPKGGDQVSYTRMAAVKPGFMPGGITRTGNSLDVAIQGDGFFVVDTPAGPRYTRNGHFQLDENGELVTSQRYPVLGEGDQPVVLPEDAGAVTISRDGTVSGGSGDFGRIQLVRFATTEGLKKPSPWIATSRELPVLVMPPALLNRLSSKDNSFWHGACTCGVGFWICQSVMV